MKINKKGDYVLVVCPNPSIDIYAYVDEFTIGNSNRMANEERYPGGKGVHVAMALSELEIEVVLLGFWGSVTGQWIKNQCNAYYPKIKCIGPELETWSRSCYTFKSESDFDETELLSAGPEIKEGDCENLINQLVEYLPKAKALALSGSWPHGATEYGYARMIKLATKLEIPSFLDSTGVQFANALKERPYCVHLNKQESMTYTGATTFEEARVVLSEKCTVSAITDGAKGLFYNKDDNTLHGLFRVDNVYSTIGSGDCLLAGLIFGHVHQLPVQEIANYGAACGAANCLRHELGMLYKKDVENLIDSL